MFKVIGSDGKQYGPVSEDEVRSWLAQGRLNSESKIKAEGTEEWKSIAELPQFGAVSTPSVLPLTPPPAKAPTTSGLAIASLVLGLLGILTAGLTGVVGLILGIVALVKIGKSDGRLRGNGLAIAGICVSGVFLLFLPIMAAMLLPALAKAKTKAQSIQCMNNVKQLNLALIMYANDNKDVLPPADKWCDLIQPYTGGSTTLYHCMTQPAGRCSYAFNASLGNRKLTEITDPARTVLVFSSEEGWCQSGGIKSVKPHVHSHNFASIGCVDGHVEIRAPGQLGSFQWEVPAQEK